MEVYVWDRGAEGGSVRGEGAVGDFECSCRKMFLNLSWKQEQRGTFSITAWKEKLGGKKKIIPSICPVQLHIGDKK